MPTAAQAFRAARPGKRVIGWKLDPAQREVLLARFPPTYAKAVADHVTLRAHVRSGSALPPPAQGLVIGRSDDGQGVEAMVVQIEGSTHRPGGGTYHITWSLGPQRRAVESNDVIAARGWEPVDPPVPVTLVPAQF